MPKLIKQFLFSPFSLLTKLQFVRTNVSHKTEYQVFRLNESRTSKHNKLGNNLFQFIASHFEDMIRL